MLYKCSDHASQFAWNIALVYTCLVQANLLIPLPFQSQGCPCWMIYCIGILQVSMKYKGIVDLFIIVKIRNYVYQLIT